MMIAREGFVYSEPSHDDETGCIDKRVLFIDLSIQRVPRLSIKIRIDVDDANLWRRAEAHKIG